MYYYAVIDTTTGICTIVYESETEIISPDHILLDEFDTSYMFRKKYVNGVWEDTTPEEAMQYNGMHVAIFGRWLDEVLNDKSEIDHTHDGYASSDDLALLEDVVDTKADTSHTHTEYATADHVHSDYALQTDVDALGEEVDGKADASHTHDNYALTSHTHTASEVGAASSDHNHDADYADASHNHDTIYSAIGHDHNESYASLSHTHADYATVASVDALEETVSEKADSAHNHNSSYDAKGAAASALSSANAYTDTAIDTLSEVVADKANATDLTSHVGNTTAHITSTERANWNAAKTHANSAHAPANAEPNQNAFSNVVVNGTTISADSKTDTLTFVAGNNVTITPDATGDSITISSANTVYTHPTTSGNKHIPAGGSSGQILRWASDGTAVWGSDNNTTYSVATQSANGLMSNTDKTKLDGIAEGANNYTLPSAGTSLGGVKTGGDVTISSGVITVNDDSHNHVISNIDGLQTALNGKAASGHNHDDNYYTETEIDTLLEGKANTSHAHAISDITNLQTTLNGKANTSHGTHVSYSTTAPVMDGTASVGTASTVARSDHKHPTDTSRAAQTDLDALETVVSGKANASHTHTIANITNLQSSLDAKQATITGGASTITGSNLTANRALISNGSGKVAVSAVTSTELGYLDGVTSNVQTQLDGKAASSHNHAASNITSGTLSSDRLPTVPISKGGTGATTAADALTNLGITATASELNKLDGVTATTAELNYIDGVTSNVQTQLNSKLNLTGGDISGKLNINNTNSNPFTIRRNSSDTESVGHSLNDNTYTINYVNDETTNKIVFSLSATDTEANSGASPSESSVTILNSNNASTVTANVFSGNLSGNATTATNVAWSGVTSKPSYYDAKAIKSITRNGTTYTYTCMDGTTGTFTQQDNNTTYNNATASTAGLMSATDKAKLDGITASADSVSFSASATSGNKVGAITINGTTTNMYAPTQTSVSGNAGTATKLATARTISLTGDVTGSTSFDGSGNVSITATVADDSHNHTIANVDGLQSALDGKSATNHNHNSAYISKDLQFTGDNGGAIISYNRDDGKNILTEIAALPAGFYTVYSQSGTAGNPKTTEAWRFMVHKTGASAGWVQGYGSIGSVYTNYIDGTNGWRGWRCVWDYDPNPLWSGQYYMSSPNSTPQTVTPSKKLSECRTGWLLLWSDYDAGSGSNDSDFVTTIIPKNDPSGNKWGGKSFLCDIPRYVGSNAEDVDTERRIIKPIYVHDDCIKGSYQNDKDERNDVVLRAVYEI